MTMQPNFILYWSTMIHEVRVQPGIARMSRWRIVFFHMQFNDAIDVIAFWCMWLLLSQCYIFITCSFEFGHVIHINISYPHNVFHLRRIPKLLLFLSALYNYVLGNTFSSSYTFVLTSLVPLGSEALIATFSAKPDWLVPISWERLQPCLPGLGHF